MRRILRVATIFWLLMPAVIVFAAGCTHKPAQHTQHDSIVATGNDAAQATAHVEAAERLTGQAKPHANTTGKALLDGASAEHDAALVKLADTQRDLQTVSRENTTLHETIITVTRERDDAKKTTGYRVGQFVARCWFWIKVVFIGGALIHIVCIVAALFLTGAPGLIIGTIGRFVNPAAWGLWIVERIRVKRALMTPVPTGAV